MPKAVLNSSRYKFLKSIFNLKSLISKKGRLNQNQGSKPYKHHKQVFQQVKRTIEQESIIDFRSASEVFEKIANVLGDLIRFLLIDEVAYSFHNNYFVK